MRMSVKFCSLYDLLMGFYCFLSVHYFDEKLNCDHRSRHDDSCKTVI